MKFPWRWLRSQKIETKEAAWALDCTDIEKCAKAWGLTEAVRYFSDNLSSRGPLGRCYLDIDPPIWLNPELVTNGKMVSGYDGRTKSLLIVYAHEVGHHLTGPGAGHNLVFAAIYAFLLARIPGTWFVDDVLRQYDVHEIGQADTPFRKSTRWREKGWRYALKTAADWGCELAEDPSLPADQDREIILRRDIERIEKINRRQELADRLYFGALGFAVLSVVVGWGIWEMTKPLI